MTHASLKELQLYLLVLLSYQNNNSNYVLLQFIYKCLFILVGSCNLREIKSSNEETLLLHCTGLAARFSLGLLGKSLAALLSADTI